MSLGAGLLLVAAVAAVASRGSNGSTAPVRRQAPLFTAPLLGGPGELTMSALQGRPAVVDFWASWCPACRADLAGVQRIARAGGATVVGVDVRDQAADAEHSLQVAGAQYRNARDPDGRVAAAFAIMGLPTLLVLDSCGQVTATFLGPVTPARVEHTVARARGCSPAIGRR